MGEQRFIDNGDGTVTDTVTTLMWMRNDSYLNLQKFVTYPAAVKYLKKINEEAFAGYSDWRFPTKYEAHSLFDNAKSIQDKYNMAIHIDPAFAPGCGYDTWTSHTRGKITAYCYSFNSGRGGHKEADDVLNTSVRFTRGTYDSSQIKIDHVPEIKDVVTKGGGWR